MNKGNTALPRSDSEMVVDFSRAFDDTVARRSFTSTHNTKRLDTNIEDSEGSSVIDLRSKKDNLKSEPNSIMLEDIPQKLPGSSFRSKSEGRASNSRIDRLPSRRSISRSIQNLNPEVKSKDSRRSRHDSYVPPGSPTFSFRSTLSLLPETSTRSGLKHQVIVTMVVSLAPLACGFAMGFNASTNPAKFLTPHYNPWTWQQHLYLIGAIPGSIFSGAILNHGRKYPLLGSVLLLLASWLAVACATEPWMVMFFHGVSGACTSVILVISQVYVAEIAVPAHRGSLSCAPLFALNVGLLICFASSEWISWKALAVLGMGITLPFLICFLICLPESPRYLIKSRPMDALKTLQWLRGTRADISEENTKMLENYSVDIWSLRKKDFLCPSFWRPCLVGSSLMFLYSMCGSASVAFYGKQLFYDSSVTKTNTSYFILTTTVLIGIFISSILIDQVGRKLLLLLSFTIMSATAFALGLFLFLKDIHHVESYFMYQWSAEIFCAVLFVLAHGTALAPVAWVTLGESFPPTTKWIGVSICSTVFWMSMLLMDIIYHRISFVIATGGLFWFHCILNVGGYIYFLLCFRELKDHSLDNISKVHLKKTQNMIDTFITNV